VTAAIPVDLAWSSPFVRWQGALASTSSIDLAVQVTGDAFGRARFDPGDLSSVVFGWTVPQPEIFYGAPTIAARIGAGHVGGPMVSQACATGVVSLEVGAMRVGARTDTSVLVVTADRTSNGPVLTWPQPDAPGGAPHVEHWVLDSFKRDPVAREAMVATAEKVAAEAGFTREELDEVTLLRHEQYRSALADDRAFQRRWMVPARLPGRRGETVVEADDGVVPTTAEGLAGLRPVTDGGVVTYGSQTHPADGTAGLVVTTAEHARDLADGGPVATILGVGHSRAGLAEMPKAPVPAARRALDAAGLAFDDVDALTTHNPFAVNDLWFARETGVALQDMNARGCSLVWGHPQGPTGTRSIVELLHTLVDRGGGVGLFTGCAAGDSGAAVVVRVDA